MGASGFFLQGCCVLGDIPTWMLHLHTRIMSQTYLHGVKDSLYIVSINWLSTTSIAQAV